MKVTFRVDSSLRIGTGHVMRCLTLADALKLNGVTSRFICRELPGHIGKLIVDRGYHLSLLPSPSSAPSVSAPQAGEVYAYEQWLGCSWKADSHDVAQELMRSPTDWLIVDHYALDRRWETSLRSYYGKLLVIDDLANRPHACDVLLDSNEFADANTRYSRNLSQPAELLLGAHYALLRPEFMAARQASAPFKQRERLFIGFGGADQGNQTLLSLRAADGICSSGTGCDIVVGASYPFVHELRCELEERNYPDVKLHVNTREIAALMGQARMAICGGGGSTWERLCVGLPSLVCATAQNQVEALGYLQKLSMIQFLGQADELGESVLTQAISDFWCDEHALYDLHSNGIGLVDGQGAGRVAEKVCS